MVIANKNAGTPLEEGIPALSLEEEGKGKKKHHHHKKEKGKGKKDKKEKKVIMQNCYLVKLLWWVSVSITW